jgi:pyrroline-5-carboxylate reductase
VKEEHMHVAQTIFESIGIVFITEENKLDAVTGVAGSGPAYIYYLVEGMIQGGIDSGLKEEEARLLVYQTLLGAGRMIKETKQNPDYLREQITSPNGTTQKGLETLDEYHFLGAVRKAVKNATSRSKELGEMQSKNPIK